MLSHYYCRPVNILRSTLRSILILKFFISPNSNSNNSQANMHYIYIPFMRRRARFTKQNRSAKKMSKRPTATKQKICSQTIRYFSFLIMIHLFYLLWNSMWKAHCSRVYSTNSTVWLIGWILDSSMAIFSPFTFSLHKGCLCLLPLLQPNNSFSQAHAQIRSHKVKVAQSWAPRKYFTWMFSI